MHNLFPHFDNIIFFDTETNGLSPERDQIIEFAGLKFRRDGFCEELDLFIRLPVDMRLPEGITTLTGITDEMLARNGMTPENAALSIMQFLNHETGETNLLIAHNAHFDLKFLIKLIREFKGKQLEKEELHVIDSLTVARDLKEYPNRLKHMIEHYNISGVKNSHRAIDDVWALAKVTIAMGKERIDLENYVNLFGMYPRFPLPEEEKIPGITYMAQDYNGRKNISLPTQKRDTINKRSCIEEEE